MKIVGLAFVWAGLIISGRAIMDSASHLPSGKPGRELRFCQRMAFDGTLGVVLVSFGFVFRTATPNRHAIVRDTKQLSI